MENAYGLVAHKGDIFLPNPESKQRQTRNRNSAKSGNMDYKPAPAKGGVISLNFAQYNS